MKPKTPVDHAAVAWWLTKRPVAWTEEQHRKSPRVNCLTAGEQRLANAVADMLNAPE
jgi:hypothetical protein